MTTTRTDELTIEIQKTFEKELATASQLGAKGDVGAMMTAINGIQAKVADQVKAKIATEKTALDALAVTEAAGKTALETHAQDLLGVVATTLAPGFEALTTVGQLVFRMDKDKDQKTTVSVVVGNLTKVSGNGASRNYKITVDGKQYDTVAIAWKEIMGDVPQPTKTVGKGDKEHQSKTADIAKVALKAAGHTVS